MRSVVVLRRAADYVQASRDLFFKQRPPETRCKRRMRIGLGRILNYGTGSAS